MVARDRLTDLLKQINSGWGEDLGVWKWRERAKENSRDKNNSWKKREMRK